MRLLLVAIALIVATPALAQSQFSPEAGAFVSVSNADLLRGGDGEVALDAEAGWRFGNGLDVGVEVGLGHTSFQDLYDTDRVGDQTRIGVAARLGYARRLGAGLSLRLEAKGGVEQADNDRIPTEADYVLGELVDVATESYTHNLGFAAAAAAVYTRAPLTGTVAFQPTLGVYTLFASSTTTDGQFSLRADTGTTRTNSEIGPEVGLPIMFRAFGTAFAVDPAVRYDWTGSSSRRANRIGASLDLRANF